MTRRLALASAHHPWLTIGAWVVALLGAVVLSVTLLSGVLTSEAGFVGNPESRQAARLLGERLADRGPDVDEIVVVRSERRTVDDPAFAAFVAGLGRQAAATGAVASAQTYFAQGDETLVSADRHATMAPLTLVGDPDVDGLLSVVRAADGTDGFAVSITGTESGDHDFEQLANDDLKTGELLGIAAALLILVAVFGALVSSLVPIVLAIVSIAVAVGLTALVGQAFELSFFVVNMITMMGLAVGIDYSLFVISRFREERAKGLEKLDAIGVAGATSSRAVFFSGLTVVLALVGMLLVPTTIFRSLAVGAILVVAVAVVAALTLLPAALSLLGDRVDALRLPVLGRRRSPTDSGRGLWPRVARGVMRRPGLALAIGSTVLITAAVPTFSLTTGSAGITTLPDGFASKQGFAALQRDFPATLLVPAQIVVDGDVRSQPVRAAIAELERAIGDTPEFGPATVTESAAGDLALVAVPLRGEAAGEAATAAVRDLRERVIPAAFDGVDARALVGGATAEEIDFVDITDRYLPIVIAFVLGLSFVLLMVAFRSLVIPAMSIVMNLLSVGAAYGLMVLVFQKGFGNDLLGFRQLDTIEPWIPLFLFSVLFGLSMDYHVFLLSRIRERYDQSGSTTDAVQFGVGSTARLITGAALIMVAVFGGFASGNLVMFQQMGFGLAVAVMLDATLVRSVLVPAAMKLLGRWNWYLPAWLRWLPHLSVEAPRELAVRPAGK